MKLKFNSFLIFGILSISIVLILFFLILYLEPKVDKQKQIVEEQKIDGEKVSLDDSSLLNIVEKIKEKKEYIENEQEEEKEKSPQFERTFENCFNRQEEIDRLPDDRLELLIKKKTELYSKYCLEMEKDFFNESELQGIDLICKMGSPAQGSAFVLFLQSDTDFPFKKNKRYYNCLKEFNKYRYDLLYFLFNNKEQLSVYINKYIEMIKKGIQRKTDSGAMGKFLSVVIGPLLKKMKTPIIAQFMEQVITKKKDGERIENLKIPDDFPFLEEGLTKMDDVFSRMPINTPSKEAEEATEKLIDEVKDKKNPLNYLINKKKAK